MPLIRKSKHLKKNRIKRRTNARAQSTQIAALSNQVQKLTKQQYENVMLSWIRPTANIDLTLPGAVNAYVLPIPITPNNPYGLADANGATAQLKWSDNRVMANAAYFQKTPVFGSSLPARESHEWIHTGSTIKWRLQTNEPTFSTYSVFLIQAKSRQADQLISDRKLKNSIASGSPGSASALEAFTDFVTHQDCFGTMINKKYWKILGSRQVNFSVPGVIDIKETNADLQGGADTRSNTVLQEGTFKIPAGGSIKNVGCMPFTDIQSPALGRRPSPASTIGYLDEDTSKTCYLVIVNNGVSSDLETTSLSTLTLDKYKVVV